MAITGFKPVLGGLTLGTGGFSLSGDNAGFCHAILGKAAGSRPGQLESLTYLLPSQGQEAGGGEAQSPVVVNLLMQLRASYDQNNIFLRTGQASQAQIMERLRQTLARSDQAVRDQAGEIERAVRNSLFQEHEFRQALKRLERELKKNGGEGRRADPNRAGNDGFETEIGDKGRGPVRMARELEDRDTAEGEWACGPAAPIPNGWRTPHTVPDGGSDRVPEPCMAKGESADHPPGPHTAGKSGADHVPNHSMAGPGPTQRTV